MNGGENMINFLEIETWVLVLYSAVGAMIAFVLYELAKLLAAKLSSWFHKVNDCNKNKE